MPPTSPRIHHHISDSRRFPVYIPTWLRSLDQDPAAKDFLPKLRAHILTRLTGKDYSGDEEQYSDEDLYSVKFEGNKLYRHKVARINYTTYDMRRDQDSLNPRTHADFMTLAHEEPITDASEKPPAYWYGRIVGIFHADVVHTGSLSINREPQRIEFLWVRWLGDDTTHRSGFKAKRLPRVGFVPDEPIHEPFGFLDPSEIIRAVHLMPAFAYGKTQGLLGHSIARQPSDNDEDWQYYYVDIWADRDMFMRFRGGGIGHKALRPIEDLLDNCNLESSEDAEAEVPTVVTSVGTEDPSLSDDDYGYGDQQDGEDDGEEAMDSDEGFLGPEDGEDQDDFDENPSY